MNDLKVIHHNGIYVVDSRDVARMVEKLHKNLLRDIENYCKILMGSNLSALDFFIPYTYTDSKGEVRPSYLVTRKGCDMVANKMTGEKGVLFSATYIQKFYEMEQKLADRNGPRTYLEALKALVASEEEKQLALAELDRSKEWYSIKRVAKMNGVDHKEIRWKPLKDESIRQDKGPKKIFDANYGEINTYHIDVWEAVYPEYEL